MDSASLKKKYLDFFKSKGHVIIPGASLIPENDPTVLFTTAGMHPLVPFLLGEKHPAGRRLVNVQKCIRTGDINEVGNARHLTFFEMLGNWSLGDYFKKEAIEWSWEFLTDKNWLGLDPKRLYVTVFMGNENSPIDQESIDCWKEQFAKAGIKAEVCPYNQPIKGNTNFRIFPLPAEDNWWGPAGQTGPCGPCTEMFYDLYPQQGELTRTFSEEVKDARIMEIWNDVFMEFNKNPEGKFELLKQKNVDTGMGVERTITALNSFNNVYETDLFKPIVEIVKNLAGSSLKIKDSLGLLNRSGRATIKEIQEMKEEAEKIKAVRIIADHLKAAVFILAEGIEPSNVERGYVLRRLIRRAIRHGRQLGIQEKFTVKVAESVQKIYQNDYPELTKMKDFIFTQLIKEEEKFSQTLEKGLKQFEFQITKLKSQNQNILSGEAAFDLYQTFGFPLELTEDLAKEKNFLVDKEGFQREYQKHQELSRLGTEKIFKGGLADHSEKVIKYHTAAHLMLAALRQVLGSHVVQKGSNITAERLRFDFSHPQKLTPEQIKKVEDLVNEKISQNLPVKMEEMTLEEAKKQGAMGVFEERYSQRVKVYSIEDPTQKEGFFSKEICGGPHVSNTGILGKFKIIKEEASSAGVRRIKAILE